MIEVDLRRFPLLAQLAREDLDAIAARLEVQALAPEQVLFREGDEAGALVLLEQGALRVDSRRDGELGRCQAPACLGAVSLLREGAREASAVAAGAARALVLTRTAFARLLDECPRAAASLLAAIGAELARLLHEGLPFVAARPLHVDPAARDT